MFRGQCELWNHLFGQVNHFLWVSHDRFIFEVLSALVLLFRAFHEFKHLSVFLEWVLGYLGVDKGHDWRIVWLKRIVELLLDLLSDRIELIDELQAVIEVEIADVLTPRTWLERLIASAATSTLLEVQELWVALVNLDEVGVFVHELDDCLVFFLVLHVEGFDGNLR